MWWLVRLHQMDSLLKGKLWIPADHPCSFGERTEIEKGRQDPQSPCCCLNIGLLGFSVIQSSPWYKWLPSNTTEKLPVSIWKVSKWKIMRNGSLYNILHKVREGRGVGGKASLFWVGKWWGKSIFNRLVIRESPGVSSEDMAGNSLITIYLSVIEQPRVLFRCNNPSRP